MTPPYTGCGTQPLRVMSPLAIAPLTAQLSPVTEQWLDGAITLGKNGRPTSAIGAVRVYSLRVEGDGASVWVNEEASGSQRTVERKKFTEPDAATAWLSNEEKRLGADGWKSFRLSAWSVIGDDRIR
jgi:hypothetical protein